MNKLFTKIAGLSIGLAMAIGVGVAVGSNSKEAAKSEAATIGTNLIQVTSLTSGNQYVIVGNNNGYALPTKPSVSSGKVTGTAITSVPIDGAGYLWTFTKSGDYWLIGDGTKYIYHSNGGNSGTNLSYGTSQASYPWYLEYSTTGQAHWTFKGVVASGPTVKTRGMLCNGTSFGGYALSNESSYKYMNIYEVASADVEATINGSSSVNVGTQWAPTSITEDVSGNTVSGATYAFAASGGAVISSSNTTTGAFTCSAAGTVTVSASKTGYAIASKTVTVNSSDPYINLTLTSGATAYTGQTVSITSEYGNGVAGLSWSVQSGSISGTATTSNSGYSAKISNTAGTLTIRATDTGSALYSEVSVTVTKTAFTTSPAATASVAEGKTTTLTAVLNSGGTINWISDDTDVATVSAGVVTGVEAGTATITATSADDSTVSASCTVTVTEAPSEIVITQAEISGFTNSYKEYDWTYGTGTNAISGKIKAYKNSSNIQMNHNNTCYIYNTDAVKGYITGITFTKVSGTTDLTCWVGTSALSSDPASEGSTNTTYTWSFSADDHYTHFRVATSGSTGARVASAITITYQKVQTVDPTGITIDDSSTINMDTYGYGRRRLSATVEPFNANDKTVTWGTSDSSVVTVADGVLTATGVGTTTVYATTVNYVSDVATPELKASVTVHVTEALYKKATFVPTSTSAATQTDDYLPDGSVSVTASTAGQYDNDKHAIQLASGKDVTFTISGYAGMKISGIDLIVSSNGSAGSGALTVTAGSTQIFAIASAAFSDETWNGAYDANACDLYRATTEYVVKANETIEIAFSASANSLYVHSVAIRYLDYSLEQWCESFLTTITCDGVGSITDDSKWDDLGLEFLDLSEELRNLAANATANKDSESVIEQAMARYDLIIRKYGTSAHDEFIGRFGPGTVNGPLGSVLISKLVSSSGTSIAIIAISAVSLAAIGGYFLFRKKKED